MFGNSFVHILTSLDIELCVERKGVDGTKVTMGKLLHTLDDVTKGRGIKVKLGCISIVMDADTDLRVGNEWDLARELALVDSRRVDARQTSAEMGVPTSSVSLIAEWEHLTLGAFAVCLFQMAIKCALSRRCS